MTMRPKRQKEIERVRDRLSDIDERHNLEVGLKAVLSYFESSLTGKLPLHLAGVWAITTKDNYIQDVARAGKSLPLAEYKPTDNTPIGYALVSKRNYHLHKQDLQSSPWKERFAGFGDPQSAIILVLKVHSAALSAILLTSTETNFFDAPAFQELREIELDLVQFYLQAQIHRLKIQNDVAHKLTQNLRGQREFQKVLDAAHRHCDTYFMVPDFGYYTLWDDGVGNWREEIPTGLTSIPQFAWTQLQEMLKPGGNKIFFKPTGNDSDPTIQSAIAVPVYNVTPNANITGQSTPTTPLRRNRIVGVTTITSSQALAFRRDDMEFVERIALQVATAREYIATREREEEAAVAAATLVSLGETIKIFSHQLRNLVTGINSSVRIIGREINKVIPSETQAPDLRERLQRVPTQGDSLIKEVADYRKLFPDKIEPSIPVQLNKFLGEIINSAEPITHEMHTNDGTPITLNCHLNCPSDVTLRIPPSLGSVLRDIVINAAKYGKNHQVNLEISARLITNEKKVEIRFKDDGIGLKQPEDRERIFKVGVRTESAEERTKEGWGLGLFGVKLFVTQAGGTVEAHSQGENLGTTFIVVLPLASETGSLNDPLN